MRVVTTDSWQESGSKNDFGKKSGSKTKLLYNVSSCTDVAV